MWKRLAIIPVLFFSPSFAICDVMPSGSSLPHWTGEWQVSEDGSRLLGYPQSDQRTSFSFPTTFQLAIDPSIKPEADEQGDSKQIFRKLNHTISHSGKWVTDPKETGVSSQRCLVTTGKGHTYLWLSDVPFVGIYGGRVSFVEGHDRVHDLLIIDFNTLPKHESGLARGDETVVYQRKR